jgi:hypothetical protein
MTRSTAPIALLISAGLVCLGFAAVTPTTTETRQARAVTRVGEAVTYQVTTSTDQTALVLSITALVLAVLAFGGAAYLSFRRFRSRRVAG